MVLLYTVSSFISKRLMSPCQWNEINWINCGCPTMLSQSSMWNILTVSCTLDKEAKYRNEICPVIACFLKETINLIKEFPLYHCYRSGNIRIFCFLPRSSHSNSTKSNQKGNPSRLDLYSVALHLTLNGVQAVLSLPLTAHALYMFLLNVVAQTFIDKLAQIGSFDT